MYTDWEVINYGTNAYTSTCIEYHPISFAARGLFSAYTFEDGLKLVLKF